jgi:hypothetical protein
MLLASVASVAYKAASVASAAGFTRPHTAALSKREQPFVAAVHALRLRPHPLRLQRSHTEKQVKVCGGSGQEPLQTDRFTSEFPSREFRGTPLEPASCLRGKRGCHAQGGHT